MGGEAVVVELVERDGKARARGPMRVRRSWVRWPPTLRAAPTWRVRARNGGAAAAVDAELQQRPVA